MKTLQQAKHERDLIMSETKSLLVFPKDESRTEERRRKKQITALKKKTQHVRDMILYLETNPTEEFIKSEAKKLKKRKGIIEAAFLKDRVNANFNQMALKDQTKAKMTYYKEMGMTKIITHLKSLNYLLS